MLERWQNQQEALDFTLSHSSCMLDMEMGTGKTRVAIDTVFARSDVHKILVVCPKAVIPVWRENLEKFYHGKQWLCWDGTKGTISKKAEDIHKWFDLVYDKSIYYSKYFIVVNYEIVWRKEMGDLLYKTLNFDMVILDESHRAKAASSKVSKYLAMLGKKTKYKICLSGTPMANSPLDVYGQYRFLDPTIFGTNHFLFKQKYAIMGGAEMKFIVGYKNQKELHEKFDSIAYTCKMSDIADRLKLPDALPPIERLVEIPAKDKKVMKDLSKEFIAECESNHVVVNNVLTKMLRLQQICSGFCVISDLFSDVESEKEMNTAKEDELSEILSDISPLASVVVFGLFRHDLSAIQRAAKKTSREYFELSGSENTLEEWKQSEGAVIGVQIQAGAEGVDMTKANHAIYFSVPHSLALYNQSKARLYRPNQTRPVSFVHLIVKDTIDEVLYKSLIKKEDIIESIKRGEFDFGFMH